MLVYKKSPGEWKALVRHVIYLVTQVDLLKSLIAAITFNMNKSDNLSYLFEVLSRSTGTLETPHNSL